MVNGLWVLGLAVLGVLWFVTMCSRATPMPGTYSRLDSLDGLHAHDVHDNERGA